MDTTTFDELCRKCVQYMLRHNDIETLRLNIESLSDDLAKLEQAQREDGEGMYKLSGQLDGFVVKLDKAVHQQAVNDYCRFEPMQLPYGTVGEPYDVEGDELISFTNGNVGYSQWYFNNVEMLEPNKEN